MDGIGTLSAPKYCRRYLVKAPCPTNYLYLTHRYTGGFEHWTFCNNVQGKRTKWAWQLQRGKVALSLREADNHPVRKWLFRLVELIGRDNVTELLRGAGDVCVLPKSQEPPGLI